jgi:hypothetical protein
MRSDRTREEPDDSVGEQFTAYSRSLARRYAGFQMVLSRAAYIVARADYCCATRPFAKTQSMPCIAAHLQSAKINAMKPATGPPYKLRCPLTQASPSS